MRRKRRNHAAGLKAKVAWAAAASSVDPAAPYAWGENIGWIDLSGANLADTDSDGIADAFETDTGTFNGPFDTGTDPNNADTDGDGANDSEEIANGTDPFDNLSAPGLPLTSTLTLLITMALLLALGLRLLRMRKRVS